jgi:hypothetical protein
MPTVMKGTSARECKQPNKVLRDWEAEQVRKNHAARVKAGRVHSSTRPIFGLTVDVSTVVSADAAPAAAAPFPAAGPADAATPSSAPVCWVV